MIDHTSLAVTNFKSSAEFYDKTLAALGYERIVTLDLPTVQVIGYGTPPKPSFWISDKGYNENEQIGNAQGVHVAFLAPSVAAVEEWHQLCLQLGGHDNGAPGPRADYHPGYYGGFIVDPSGWRIEACFHQYSP